MKKLYLLWAIILLGAGLRAQLPQINLVQVATGFNSPVDIKNCGDDRLFIVEQDGLIRIMYKNGTIRSTPFLDLTGPVNSAGNEQGLLGLAFSPNFKSDGIFYVNYVGGSNSGYTNISRFRVSVADSNVADAGSEQVILSFTQPFVNHNGGGLQFGPDGYLYDSQGDGGSQNDPDGNGQNTNVYLAKILRLDVSDTSTTYTIPPANPFAGQPNSKGEVWAYGLRNPWRISFDRITGDFWIADVGQNAYEEINFQPAASAGGQNYGWRCREGVHTCSTCTVTGCTGTSFNDPVFEYAHSNFSSCSVTGGYVYRGAQYSSLWGRYLLTDYCSGQFWSIRQTAPNVFDADTLQDFTNNQYTTFGQDNNGELYLAYRGSNATNGRIYRITETGNCSPVAFITLQDTLSFCSSGTLSALQGDTLNYQWYNSSGIINGANARQYNVQQPGWYKVQVSKQQGGCNAMSDSVYVTINQPTTLNPAPGDTVVCRNSAPLSLSGYISPAGGIYTGSGISASVFNPANAPATGAVQYTYTNQYGCQSIYSFNMRVLDTASLTLTASDLSFCISQAAVSLGGHITPAGGVYSGTGVSADSIFTPVAAGEGTHRLTYTYVNGQGCTSVSAINALVGDKTPLTDTTTAVNYCSNSAAFSLAGFISPPGGTYSGNGVSNNIFSPATAGTGLTSIIYTYTNNYGCVSADTFRLNVTACTGIEPLYRAIQFEVFPNPSKGVFQIRLQAATAQNAVFTLADAAGKIYLTRQVALSTAPAAVTIDMPQLAKGIYTLRLQGETGSTAKQIVIE